MYCKECNRWIHDGAPFCPYCGRLTADVQPLTQTGKGGKIKKQKKLKKSQRIALQQAMENEQRMQAQQAANAAAAAEQAKGQVEKYAKKQSLALLIVSFVLLCATIFFYVYAISDGILRYYFFIYDETMLLIAFLCSICSWVCSVFGFFTSIKCKKNVEWLFVLNLLNMILASIFVASMSIAIFLPH